MDDLMSNLQDRPMNEREEQTARLNRYTTGEAAEVLGCKPSQLLYMIKRGYLPAESENKNGNTGSAGRYFISGQTLDDVIKWGRLHIVEMQRLFPRMKWRSEHDYPSNRW